MAALTPLHFPVREIELSDETEVLREHLPIVQSAWDVTQARLALDCHEEGDFSRAAQMVDAMGRDDRISAVLSTRINGVLGLPFQIKASSQGDQRVAGKVAKDLEKVWFDIAPEPVVAEILKWSRMLGVWVGALAWRTEPGRWTPRIQPLNPQYLRFDWAERRYVLQVEDGDRYPKAGDGQWILACPHGSRSWMGGSVRPLTIPWLARQAATRDWARSNEVHGQPIRGCVVPMDADPRHATQFYSSIKSLATETTLKLPQDENGRGFDLKLIEAEADSHEAFNALITSANVSIAIELLGQNLTTEVQGGSYASARVHERIRVDYLQTDAEWLSTLLREQICKPWAALNYGDPKLAPWPTWDAEPVADHRSEAQTLATLGNALLNVDTWFERFGLEVDPTVVAERFGISVRKRTGGSTPKPPSQAPPGNRPPADDQTEEENEAEAQRKADS